MSRGQPIREEAWHKAQQRVLAYLQFLRLPSPENLELALKALKRARAELEVSPEVHPAAQSWRALQTLLSEEAAPDAQDPGSSQGKMPSLIGIQSLCGEIQSMPALNRSSMVPGKLR